MTADSKSFMAPNALKKLRIRRAIAAAQNTCQLEGKDSPACELTWDHALALQVASLLPGQPGMTPEQ